jgi:lipopolysaccharide export system permease protein
MKGNLRHGLIAACPQKDVMTPALTATAQGSAVPPSQTGRMNGLSVYIAKQVGVPFLLFAVSLTALVWLTQSLRVLDVIVNQGQSAGTFVTLAVLLIPGLLSLILPVALFCAIVFSLNRLQSDSELVVMWSAGFSRWSVAKPVLLVTLIVTLAVYAINLYFMPAGMRAFKDRVFEIRGDLVAAFLREGSFTTPADGITAYVRETEPSGIIKNIFVDDRRKKDAPETYLAERGRVMRTESGPRLLMWNGTIQRRARDGKISIMNFDQYTFDISQLAGDDGGGQIRETSERFLSELLWPNLHSWWDVRYKTRLWAEGHSRLSGPLYAVLLAMLGITALLAGHITRRGANERIAMAAGAALLVRLSGVGLQSLATEIPALNALQYLVPLAGIAFLAWLLDRELAPMPSRAAEGEP